MSGKQAEAEKVDVCCCCANCGVAEVDNIKLEDCDGCDLVLCGSEWCRVVHRQQHDQEHKKREAELHDKELFTHPDETHLGECPLCFLPLPFDVEKCAFYSCCSKLICGGCVYAGTNSNGNETCPFCREPALLDDDKEHEKRELERIKANDPVALRRMGTTHYTKGDYGVAFECWTKAAELGDVEAHYQLSTVYRKGEGVEKNEEKEVYHLEKAAIGGHPGARYNLGYEEWDNGNIERSVKHFIIAANLGYEKSMKALWKYYSAGNITKQELENTLRTHQAALDEMKSPEREAVEKILKNSTQRG